MRKLIYLMLVILVTSCAGNSQNTDSESVIINFYAEAYIGEFVSIGNEQFALFIHIGEKTIREQLPYEVVIRDEDTLILSNDFQDFHFLFEGSKLVQVVQVINANSSMGIYGQERTYNQKVLQEKHEGKKSQI